MQESVDVIMLTRDHPAWVEAAMRDWRAQDIPAWTGYLVDNGERTSLAVLALAKDYGWRYLTAHRNLHFAAAVNWAARAGNGDRLFLLNDDATLQPECVHRMLAHDAAIVGARICYRSGLTNHAGIRIRREQGLLFPEHIGRGEPPGRYTRCHTVEAVTFAAVAIQRDAWALLGGFDEKYVWSFEDVDLCVRARKLQMEVVVCCAAEVAHDELGTRTQAHDQGNWLQFCAQHEDMDADPPTGMVRTGLARMEAHT